MASDDSAHLAFLMMKSRRVLTRRHSWEFLKSPFQCQSHLAAQYIRIYSSGSKISQSVIEEYWRHVMSRTESTLSTSGAGSFQKSSTPNIADLISKAIKVQGGEGDVWPTLWTTQAMEYYTSRHSLDERRTFLGLLAKDFGVNEEGIRQLAREVGDASQTGLPLGKRGLSLRTALTPLYEVFFDRIHQAPGGLAFLVRMRQDLLQLTRSSGNNAHLKELESSLKSKLQVWFGSGFLELHTITWESTSAQILEQVMDYEAVHAIPSWSAMKQRLGPGRKCFAFLHRGMPNVPLCFIQSAMKVALVDSVSSSVQAILHDTSPCNPNPRVAIFYSITSTQQGLSGIDLGSFLIKRVVRELTQTVPGLHTFCTLSPIPGFRTWLESQIDNQQSTILLFENEIESIKSLLLSSGLTANGDERVLLTEALEMFVDEVTKSSSLVETASASALSSLSAGLSGPFPTACQESKTQMALRPILFRLCSHYLLREKRRCLALDPVTNFHVRNGAQILRLNWLGDVSIKGLSQSYGLMVNYHYDLDAVERNNAAYLLDGHISMTQPPHPSLTHPPHA